MNEVKKFIPMDENGEISEMEKAGIIGGNGSMENTGVESGSNSFKVCGASSNLPAKPTAWSKLKGILTAEVNVELTPYQQKVEDEINEFLHQEVTWKKFKDFLFQEITITW